MDDLEFSCLSKGVEPTWDDSIKFQPMLASAPIRYPNATWRGSPNYWTGRNGYQPIAIVDHIMASSMESADGWFLNPASEVSAHFGVARDGRVYQWVDLNNSAWANGIMGRPTMSIDWIAECYNKGINPNLRTISIEHEGQTGQTFTKEQTDATIALHKWLIAQYNIPVERVHLVRHADIDSVNRPYCPGSGFPWTGLLSALKPQPTIVPQFNPNPNNFSIGPGMLTKLTELQLQAATNEQYLYPGPNQPGLGKMSQLWTNIPGIKLEAYEQLDENNQPTGAWDVQVYKQQ